MTPGTGAKTPQFRDLELSHKPCLASLFTREIEPWHNPRSLPKLDLAGVWTEPTVVRMLNFAVWELAGEVDLGGCGDTPGGIL